jgi:hypothetical protein
MAGDWIKMRKELLTSPKVVRIMSACDADRFRTIGGLFAVWSLFDEQTQDGILDGYTTKVLDSIVGFDGLSQAMLDVGWLETDEKGRLIAVNFEEHNGKTAKRRAAESVRKMSARHADKKRPREEKRREERDTTKSGISCARPSIDDVAAYCRERGNTVDPQSWMDHYTANGWKVGRNPMKDWKAAVRQWERNDLRKPSGKAGAGPVTFGQQRQQNTVDLMARLKAQDEAGGQARIGQEAGK